MLMLCAMNMKAYTEGEMEYICDYGLFSRSSVTAIITLMQHELSGRVTDEYTTKKAKYRG